MDSERRDGTSALRLMKVSALFAPTRRPDEASRAQAGQAESGYELLVRGGFVAPLAAGLTSTLPLMQRVVNKINTVIREEMAAAGAQEVLFPSVHPADIWRETGRLDAVGPLLARFLDRNGREMVLAVTAEEVAVQIAKSSVQSYRDLPFVLYQIGPKYRDEPRPRAGLLRGRLFEMKDAYSFAATTAQMEQQYQAQFRAYTVIFARCGVPQVFPVAADPGMMGGRVTHEFMLPAEVGEDTLIVCDSCGQAANQQIATVRKPQPEPAEPLPVEKIATPDAERISDLGRFGIAPEQTMKAVMFAARVPGEAGATRDVVVMALVRGDMGVSHTKLANALRVHGELAEATPAQIASVGAVPGYASPLGLRHADLVVVADDLISQTPNLVGGANQRGFHLLNLNAGRDFTPDVVADIVEVHEGMPCPNCGAPLRAQRGIEVGNIFQLGSRYSDAVGALFLDADGERRPVLMGSYGIGPTRLAASIAEVSRDERGLAWPVAVAPYHVHLVTLGKGDAAAEVQEAAQRLVEGLLSRGVEVLWDDRDDASAGVKFAEADLWGMPVRATISPRALKQGAVEVKLRTEAEATLVPLDNAVEDIAGRVAALWREIDDRVRPLSPTR
jgi:prolyl-tRNA synthetase